MKFDFLNVFFSFSLDFIEFEDKIQLEFVIIKN